MPSATESNALYCDWFEVPEGITIKSVIGLAADIEQAVPAADQLRRSVKATAARCHEYVGQTALEAIADDPVVVVAADEQNGIAQLTSRRHRA